MRSLYRRELSEEGLELRALEADLKEGVTFATLTGEDVAAPRGKRESANLAWRFDAAAGPYDLWVQFASERPCDARIELNETCIIDKALREVTFGKLASHQTWIFQGRIALREGGNELALRAAEGLPCVRAVKLVPAAGEALERAGAPQAPPPRSLADTDLGALVRAVTPALRTTLARGAGDADVNHAITAVVRAIRADFDNPQARLGFRGPLNGQTIRQSIFVELDKRFVFDAFVETGAYLGTTTEMFATYERPVHSCESNEDYYYRAAVRLARFDHVELMFADSRQFLRKFCERNAARYNMPFVYLDAHWNDDLPLPEEIELITAHFPRFVIMVDDFKHPEFGYKYDKYSTGIELTLSYLLPLLPSKDRLDFLFPVYPEHLESPPRRGTLVIAPHDVAAEIAAANLPLAAWT